MHVTVNITNLKAALLAVKPAIPSRSSVLPVLNGVRVEAGGGKLAVAATDLDLTIETFVPAEVVKAGVVIIPHKLLSSILQGKKPVTLRTVEGTDEVEVSGLVTARLVTLPLAEYPRLPDAGDFPRQLPVDMGMVARVLPAASSEDSRPILTGVFFDGAAVVATDSYRLHKATTVDVEYPQLLIPSSALAVVAKAVVGKPKMACTMLLPAEDQEDRFTRWSVQFRAGTTTWTSRLIEGEFPRWRQLLREQSPASLVVNRDEMITAVRQVATFVRDTTTPVVVALDHSGTVVLTVTTEEVGTVSATVAGEYVGVDMTIGFNPAFLIACLEAGGTSARFEMLDHLHPAQIVDQFTEDGQPTVIRLLMPVRIV